MSETSLQQKLQARRSRMGSSMTTKASSPIEELRLEDQEMVEELPAVDQDEEKLKSDLEQRREKSRRLLEQQEQDESSQQTSSKAVRPSRTSAGSDLGQSETSLSGRLTPLTTLPSSPRSDSRSSTPFGKLTLDAKSRLKSQLAARSLARRSGSGTSEARYDRPRRLRDRVTRSQRLLAGTREREDDSLLVSRVESTLKWKRAAEAAKQQRGEPSDQDCYDFFTKQYEDKSADEEEEPKPETSGEAAPEASESALLPPPRELPPAEQEEREMMEEIVKLSGEGAEGGGAEEQPAEAGAERMEAAEEEKLLSDVVAKDLDWHLFDITPAEYVGHSFQVETERLKYFIPSRIPPSFANKIEENTAPRYLEDEGIFVGDRPVINPTNVNIMENRILHDAERGHQWFGLDGQIESLPNPLKQIQTRPWAESQYEVDENLQTYYVKAYVPSTEEKYFQGGENELQINLGTVSFFHHPLMSREHVLASNITQMYDEYIDRKQKNFVAFFVDKLAALRNAVSDLKDHSFPRNKAEDGSSHESHILDYVLEIRRTTHQLNAAETAERDLMKRIIEEWKQIKRLREQQGYINTTVKLTIRKEEVNKEQDKAKWIDEVNMELSERKQEHNATLVKDYHKSMEKYRVQMEKWKENRRKIKEQRKKNAADKENLLEDNEVDDSEITIAGNVDKPQKPDKPAAFDEGTVRITIMNELMESRRNPGEDKISLLLTNTTSVTPPNGIPSEEAARRKAVQKASILLKVRFNGKEVFSTDPRPLSTDFKLHFGLIFRIRIVQWPESLKVQFLEDGLVTKTMFSEVFLRVPDTSVHSGNVQLGLTNFASDHMVAGEHTGVGSNTPFTLRFDDPVPTSVNTHGQLICCVSWGLNEMGEVLGPKGAVAADPFSMAQERRTNDPVRDLGAEAIQDPKSVTKWVQDTRLDPNDPENAALIPFMEDVSGHNVFHALDYFRLEQLQEEFNFLTDDEFEQMNRLRLLRLRYEEVNEFRNLAMVPCLEHEVLDSTFLPYERRLKDKAAVMEGDKFLATGTLSSHRLEVLQYRERVQDQVISRFFAARHYRTFEDVVHEEQVPDVKTLGLALGKAVEPRRPLKPVRKERKKATGQALTEGSVNILVTVVRAHHLPTRQILTQTQPQPNLASSLRGPATLLTPTQPTIQKVMTKMLTLAPFVAVSFQDNVVTSRVGLGPSPSWNEELKVPFSSPNNDYSSSSLQTVDDVIFIHLFDRMVEDLPSRDEDPSLITQKVTNHWLGSFKIPFSTLYHRGNIDGTFKLKVPPVLLGYDMDVRQPGDLREEFESQLTRYASGCYLTLYITLDPILRPVDPVKGRFQSKEDEAVLAKCASFLADCQRKYPQRNVKTTVIDLKGESVLITRYITPLQPPAELTDGSEFASIIASGRIARFVSLIPFASDNVTFAGVCDLWSTCDQFLHMLKGDEEEHAVLLLNYFLHLGKKAYLVLGSAIPEGNTAYVLTHEANLGEYYIWNASTGEYFSSKDSLCPLKSVGTLVNNENIWFNVQSNELPSKVQYNLSKSSDWKPLFSAPPPQGLTTIQPPSLFYVATDRAFVAKLTQTITERLKNKIMEWRPRHVTRWNRTCSSILMDILRGLEDFHSRRQNRDTYDHTSQLLQRMGEYKMSGFPMDMPFTDMESIITAVRSTEVHKIQDTNVEFSLAVYIHPYPSSVLAVWIYVAALISQRRYEL